MYNERLRADTLDELTKLIDDYFDKYPVAGYITVQDEIERNLSGYTVLMTRNLSCN